MYLVCDVGWYGFKCKDQCGYCFVNDSCYYINGSCFFGCYRGYFGDFCCISKFVFYLFLN